MVPRYLTRNIREHNVLKGSLGTSPQVYFLGHLSLAQIGKQMAHSDVRATSDAVTARK